MGKLKTRAVVLCAALLIVMMVTVPSVTARCSNTPQPAAWGYNYWGTMTIEDYGDLVGYLASVCGTATCVATVCGGCVALVTPIKAGACGIICAGMIAGIPCAVWSRANWDYTDKNRWLRRNCASHHRRLVDWYIRAWWAPLFFLPYTNARCGC